MKNTKSDDRPEAKKCEYTEYEEAPALSLLHVIYENYCKVVGISEYFWVQCYIVLYIY